MADDIKAPAFLQKQSNILTEAESIIYGDREQTYGHPAKNLSAIGILWSAHIHAKYGIEVMRDAEDVCWMMVQLKSARAMNKHSRDNQVDAAGYVALVERIRETPKAVAQSSIVQGGIAPMQFDNFMNLGGEDAEA